MAVQGVFLSSSHVQGGRVGDFAGEVLRYNTEGDAPFFALSSGMKREGAVDNVTTWFQQNVVTGRSTTATNAGTGTTFTALDATFWKPGSVLLVETTGERMFVTGISGNVVTVTRGFAETTITAFDGSSTAVGIQEVGNAYEEASDRPQAIAFEGYPVTNLMQTFRDSYEVSLEAQAVKMLHVQNLQNEKRRQAASLHAQSMERAMIFGRKNLSLTSGRRLSTMDGVIAQIKSNVIDQTGTPLTRVALRDYLQDLFAVNIVGEPNERIAFVGNNVLAVLDTLALNNATYNLQSGVTSFGMQIKRFETPFGNIMLKSHPMFIQNPLWQNLALFLHPGAVKTRYLRNTTWDDNASVGTRNGRDADFGVVTTQMLVELHLEATSMVIENIETAGT